MSKPKDKNKFRARAVRTWNKMREAFSSAPPTSPPPPHPISPPVTPSSSITLGLLRGSRGHRAFFVSSEPSSAGTLPLVATGPLESPLTAPLVSLPTAIGTNAWARLREALSELHKRCTMLPSLQLAVNGLIPCLEMAEESAINQARYNVLVSELTGLVQHLDQHLQTSVTVPTSDAVVKITWLIQEQVDHIGNGLLRNKDGRFVKEELDDQATLRSYRQIQELFKKLQMDISLSIWNFPNEPLEGIIHDRTRPVNLAPYNSSLSTMVNRRMCAENTCTRVLSDLNTWINDLNAPNVYWMNGMAGTGKTTVAWTFAKLLEERKQLGASFFCTRTTTECQDLTRIMPTIAYQLALYSNPFKSALSKTLADESDFGSWTVLNQFERLLEQPLMEVKDALPGGLVVVIDALDECNARGGVELVLDTLLQATSNLPLKFFVTSRPESGIRNKIRNRPNTSRSAIVLHDIEQSLVQADIKLYLQKELDFITPSEVDQLAKRAGQLFIYAATVVRHVRTGKTPGDLQSRLRTVLSISSASEAPYAEIDQLYASILSAAIDNSTLEIDAKEYIRPVLWTVACACEPISIETLVDLTGASDHRKTLTMLQTLQSVLYVSENKNVVSTLHVSFYDFIFDPARSSLFFCDTKQHSQLLVRRCFELMGAQLCFNIGRLESSYLSDKMVPNLKEHVEQTISPALAYSCRYWANHLREASPSSGILDLLQIFLSEHLLFWMEVMNLKHWTEIAARAASMAKLWLMANHSPPKLAEFAADAHNFVSSFASNPISQSTPHIYVSALPFHPQSNAVSKHYLKRTNGLIRPKGTGVEQRTSAMLGSWKVDSEVNTVAYSLDGTHLAIGCNDGSIIVKSAYDSSFNSGPFKGHTRPVRSVTFSRDGSRIGSGSGDRTICVWNSQDGTLVGGPFKGHAGYVTSVAFSPDGEYIVSGSDDHTIRLWDLQSGALSGVPLKGHTDRVTSVAFSTDGSLIVSGSSDCTIRVWNIWNGSLFRAPLEGHTGSVTSAAFSFDGTQIVSGSGDHTIRLWNVCGDTLASAPIEGHTDWVRSVAFSPDGTRIVSGSDDRTICIWDARDGDLIGYPFRGHTGYVTSVAFSPDGTRILSGSDDRTIRLWNSQDVKVDKTRSGGHLGCVMLVAFSPDGTRIVSGSGDGSIRIWSVHDGSLIGDPLEGHTGWVRSVAFSPDGARVVSGSSDKTIRVWDAHRGTPLGSPLEGHAGWVRSVAFSPDGTRIVSGSSDRTIRIWSAEGGGLDSAPLVGHTGYVTSVVFSPDGTYVVSGSDDRTVRIWNVKGETSADISFEGHTSWVTSVAFSPDGTRIVSGSNDRTIRLWNVQDGTLVANPFRGHIDTITSVAFSPDGTRIASGSDDRTIRVWDARDGTLIDDPFTGHNGNVTSVAFSPDGTRIISGSNDCSIRVWDLCYDLPLIGSWTVLEDGWVVDHHSQRLFWVPSEIARALPTPYNSWVIGPNGSISIDHRDACLGEDWYRCYISK